MFRFTLPAVFFIASITSFGQKVFEYPETAKDAVYDEYFGERIADPYQWMENPNDPRLIVWLAEQKKLVKKQQNRQTKLFTLRSQLVSMYHDESSKSMENYIEEEGKKSKYEFDYHSSRYGESPDLRYRKRESPNFFTLVRARDFKTSKADNAFATNYRVNSNETKVAVEISHSGSDWREVYFFNLSNGKQLPDTLKYLRGSSQVIWFGDGVYYDRYSKPKEGRALLDKASGQTLYYHKMGSSQEEDVMLYQNPDITGTNPFWYSKRDSNRFFFYHSYNHKGTVYRALSFAEITNTSTFFLKNFLIYPNDESISFVIEELFGDTAVLRTTWNAPNGKVLITNINKLSQPQEIIPEFDVPLRQVNKLGKNKLACIYRSEGQFLVLIYDLGGKLLKTIDFPKGKKVHHFYENDEDAQFMDFKVSSFYHPDLWYQLSLKDFTFKPSEEVEVPYKAEDLETRYVKYRSKDGTEVPMYITCQKKTKLDGNNPTLLYGYGGYGRTVEPVYDRQRTLWLLHGGILAIPNVRGGGAEGSEWGLAGRRLNKQNAIDDFIAAAEYLIESKYTNPEKLAVSGGSHGGLLVGATITQRPELFKVAIAEAGAFDMLRFEKYTVGSVNTNLNEFGSPRDSLDYLNLKSYSPLHNVKEGVKYPNVLLFTGNADDRVPPFHSYKFLANLQEKGDPNSLYQIHVIPGAGHGGALTNEDWEEKLLFHYYFLFDQLDLKF